MATFLFDILPETEHVKPTVRLAFLLKEKGHEVYYTDSSDSVFTARLLKAEISRVVYPDDFRWFNPDLVLLDQELREKGEFYESVQIAYIYTAVTLANLNMQDVHLILAATPLDYSSKQKAGVLYAGPLWDTRSVAPSLFTAREKFQVNRLRQIRKEKNGVILFCLLDTDKGHITSDNMNRMYGTLKSLCMRYPEYELILSIKKRRNMNELFPLPLNFHLFNEISEDEFLPYSDLMITDGELSRLTTCVYANIPVLVYPSVLKKKQIDNALRIVSHGLGLSGSVKTVTPLKVHEQISQLLYIKDKVLQNISVMRQLFDEKNRNAAGVIDWLEQLISKINK